MKSPKRAQTTACAALWQNFSSNKSAPANRKKGFYASRLPKNEEIRRMLYEAPKNFELFIKQFKIKFKR